MQLMAVERIVTAVWACLRRQGVGMECVDQCFDGWHCFRASARKHVSPRNNAYAADFGELSPVARRRQRHPIVHVGHRH